MGSEAFFRIGELAARTGKTVRALHLYEELGLVTPAKRTESGYRMYDESNAERVEFISCLQRLDLSLSEIADVLSDWRDDGPSGRSMARLRSLYEKRLAAIHEKRNALDALEAELRASMTFLDGCVGCEQTKAAPQACAQCVDAERAEEPKPTLISGLLVQ